MGNMRLVKAKLTEWKVLSISESIQEISIIALSNPIVSQLLNLF